MAVLEGKHEPVAIVGMGCRWAGGVKDPPSMWQLLRNNRDGWHEFVEPHFPAKGFYHPNQERPGSVRTRGGFLCDGDGRLFDHAFFGIMGREVETMDPAQRKLLEVVYEAFENAGETWDSISGSRTGVYIGNFALDHLLIQSRDWDYVKPYAATGAETSILANRISYVFNLHGPSLATNTACSSSMYALHLAVSAIRNGDCDGAIVAAANWISDPSMQIVLDKLGALSPTSRCHTFDSAADGYARGEGHVALYLKKSDLAILESMPIRAMIRGTGVNANGKTGGITRPSSKGQEDAIRKAYENAGNLPFADTAFFECHGTGTPAGDPLEVSAVGNVFASSRSDAPEDRLLIGSVKPNLGHTEGASALASIMKVVLSIEAGEVPPTFGIENLNPNIDFDGAKVHVVKDRTMPWPKNKPRRASVNSFGFGGANGHCIVDHVRNVLPGYVKPGVLSQAPRNRQVPNGYMANGHALNGYVNGHTMNGDMNGHTMNGDMNGHTMNGDMNGHVTNGHADSALHDSTEPLHSPLITSKIEKVASEKASTRQMVLLPFSAHNASSLKLNIDAMAHVINQWSLADVAYTLSCKRSRLQQRTFRIVDKDDPRPGLVVEERTSTAPVQTSNIAFVFTGQGAQWPAMGAQLFEYTVFRNTISYLDHVIRKFPTCPSWTIADTLSGKCESSHVQSPQVSQVVCTAVQIGLVDLLASWSVRPVAVAGHSSGEMAAAYASGHITAGEAIAAAHFRGEAVSRNTKKGAMLAVGLGEENALEYFRGKEEQVGIAAMNSPGSVTLSGDADAIETISNEMTKEGIFNRVLRTSGSAYHSHHMLAIGSTYLQMLRDGAVRLKKLGLADKTERYPKIPWASSVTPDKVIADEELSATYWRANLESPVRFTQAITKMMSLENETTVDVVLEVGPHGALKGPIDQTLKNIGKPARYVPSLQRNEDGRRSVLQLAGSLFAVNARIDLAAVNSMDDTNLDHILSMTHGCTAVDLPAYQYTYGPMSYYESRMSKEFRIRDDIRHDLLGSAVLGASKLQPQWRNILRTKDVPWLGDHRLLPDAVFPAAGFVAIGVEAATKVHHALPDAVDITGYSLRNIDIDTALRIPEGDEGIEIITSLEVVDTATATEPAWVKFAIQSVTGDSGEWTQHCTGLIKVDVSSPITKLQISPKMDPRFPNIAEWYDKFTEIGLGYGEPFRPLSQLQVDPDRSVAQANIALNTTAGNVKGGESHYPLHPAALDATFQLAIINFYGGQLDRANTAFVPVHISDLYLRAGIDKDCQASAIAEGSIQGLRTAHTRLQMADPSGNVFLEVDAMRFASFKESTKGMQSKQSFSSPYTRLVWKPDFRSLSNSQIRNLFPPPPENVEAAEALEVNEMICSLVAFDIYEAFIAGNQQVRPKGDIRHWLAWIGKIVEGDQRPTMVEARKLSRDQRRELLQKLYNEAGDRPEPHAARLLHESAADILNERRQGIDILVSHKLLTPLYEIGTAIAGSHPQVFNIMDTLAHANPNQRILEIGAGTGAATRAALKALAGPNGIKRYADYTFTDISAAFLTSAKEMLASHRDMNYSVLDIEKNPLEHGYEPVYDVVLACEAIHATESMDRTLAHCRSLLKPGGKLVLVETTRMRILLGLLYGTLTGYWQADDRTEGPFMSLETWQRRLPQNGFSEPELVLDDYDAPHNTTSVFVTSRVDSEDAPKSSQSSQQGAGGIYLLHDTQSPPMLLEQLAAEFKRRGATCKSIALDEAVKLVPANARVIAFLSSTNDLFDADEHRLKSYQYLARSVKSMVWLTPGGIIEGRNSRAAFMTGLLRVIAAENPAGRFLSISTEGDNFERGHEALVHGIVDKELALQADDAGEETFDGEFAWHNGCLWVSRVVPDAGSSEYSETIKAPTRQGFEMLPINVHEPVRAAFENAGVLNSLYFRPYTELLQPIPSDHVDVKVVAVGLNRKNIESALGRNTAPRSSLSSEYAGVVAKVGTEVAGLSVGDHVFGVGKGQLGNLERVPAAFAERLRPTDNFSEAATMPLAYMSAVYALEYAVRLRKGQKVLIQSATEDVGLAAIQIARLHGAEIFATVTASDQVAYLTESVGLQPDHVLYMHDPGALLRVKGFDVILSTGSGSGSMHHFLKALAPMGHLIDIGRADALASKELGLEPFQKNINYSAFDLDVVLDNKPDLGGKLIKTVSDLFQAGHIAPIRPVSVSDVSDLDQTLLSFSKSTPIGKLVVSFQNPQSEVKMIRQPRAMTFDPDARYVVTGGFGGLGRSIIRWMANRGAHDVVVLSRRGAESPAACLLLSDLKSQGVAVEALACDVTQRDQVMTAIKHISAPGRPIKGVIHAVLSLSDLSFNKLSIDQWHSGTAAKTLGSINLHEATKALSLDFFVMLTSTETIWAPPTQAAYIAADNFAAYFARYRRSIGLPASTVSYGFVSDVGSDYREISHGTEDMYARNLAATMTEQQALAALEPAFFDAQDPQQWVGKQHDPLSAATLFTCLNPMHLANLTSNNVPRWHRDGRVSLIMRAMNDARRHAAASDGAGGATGDASSATAQLRRAFADAIQEGPSARTSTVDLVTDGIAKTIAEMLFIDAGNVNPSKSVAEHGVDSLIAAELRGWFHQALRTDLTNLLDSTTSIQALAEDIVDKALKGRDEPRHD